MATHTQVIQRPFKPVGNHTTNSSLSSSTALTNPGTGDAIVLQALTQNIRMRLDDGTPTASAGFQLKAGDPAVIVPVSASTSIKVIEETSGAVLQYQWIRYD